MLLWEVILDLRFPFMASVCTDFLAAVASGLTTFPRQPLGRYVYLLALQVEVPKDILLHHSRSSTIIGSIAPIKGRLITSSSSSSSQNSQKEESTLFLAR